MILVTDAAFGGLAVAGALSLIRLLRGPSLADRIVALDSLLVVIVCGLAVDAARTREGTYLDVLVVTALLGFIGTVTVARFIERRGA
ncbi:MAG: monovalent cation/H+ antiporter complex subunit F [Acidimicrobiales bacterium]